MRYEIKNIHFVHDVMAQKSVHDVVALNTKEKDNAQYIETSIAILIKQNCENILEYVREVVSDYFKENIIYKEKEKLKCLNDLIIEASSNKGKLKDRKNSEISDFKLILVGCLTTIAEEIYFKVHKDKKEIPPLDVPEYLDFVGICAKKRGDENPSFRFIKNLGSDGEKEIGRTGFEMGKYGYTHVISSNQFRD